MNVNCGIIDMELNQITERIIGAAYEVSNILGCGFLEKVYENALVKELKCDITKMSLDSVHKANPDWNGGQTYECPLASNDYTYSIF